MKDMKQYEAVAEALGYRPDPEDVDNAVAQFAGWETRAIEVSLENLESQFADAGGRGVELADEIDAMRMALAVRKAPCT